MYEIFEIIKAIVGFGAIIFWVCVFVSDFTDHAREGVE
jgi:hypothetical protein